MTLFSRLSQKTNKSAFAFFFIMVTSLRFRSSWRSYITLAITTYTTIAMNVSKEKCAHRDKAEAHVDPRDHKRIDITGTVWYRVRRRTLRKYSLKRIQAQMSPHRIARGSEWIYSRYPNGLCVWSEGTSSTVNAIFNRYRKLGPAFNYNNAPVGVWFGKARLRRTSLRA